MLAKTPPRPPVDMSDPIVQLLLKHASPDLMAPPRPRIVNHRCGDNLGEKETFDALHYLTRLYEATGRKDFTVNDIARYTPGISRGRITAYMRGLCDKGLVDVTGHREIKGLDKAHWTAHYNIDIDRLRNESLHVVAADLRCENLPPPLRSVRPAPGQTEMPLEDDGDQHPGMLAPTPPDAGSPHRRMSASGSQEAAGNGSPHRRMSASGSPHRRVLAPTTQGASGAGSPHPTMRAAGQERQPTPQDAGSPHPTMRAAGQDGAASTVGCWLPASDDAVGGMWGGRDVSGDVGERAAPSPASEIAILFQQTISPITDAIAVIQQTLGAMQTATGATFTPVPPPPDESIPPAPAGEPALDTGPVALWGILTGRVSGIDGERIKEIVRRFEQPSQGHAAYWLARALSSVALEDAPLTLNYAAGILRRMNERNDWSTSELMRRPKESRPEPTEAAPVQRGKATTSPASETTSLPDEVAQHGAIAAWRRYAGPAVAITLPRAQEIIVKVTDLPVWEAVLTNWQVQYQARANWGHFEGLLERYVREMAAGSAPPAESATLPDLSTRWIQLHPGLSVDERAAWVMRFHRAGGKAEKRALLTRFLAEHPITEGELVSC